MREREKERKGEEKEGRDRKEKGKGGESGVCQMCPEFYLPPPGNRR